MPFEEATARGIAGHFFQNHDEEQGLIESFVQVCRFLEDNPDRLSWRTRSTSLSIYTAEGLHILASKYHDSYHKSDFPAIPATIPDAAVSIVMMEAFGYSQEASDQIKAEHQLAMAAENCVGTLLERYLDSALRPSGWSWCCGNFVKAVDFVKFDQIDGWLALQIKNRDNSENSSSSAIRKGTPIQKWFRSFSRTGKTNWGNLPPLMQGFDLSEQGFIDYIRAYLVNHKR